MQRRIRGLSRDHYELTTLFNHHIGGTLNYEVNDRVTLSLAGYKDLVRPEGLYPYRYGPERDYSVGASAFFKLLQNVFIQVSAGVSSWR